MIAQYTLCNPQQAHPLIDACWKQAKPRLMAGERLVLTLAAPKADRTVQQNRYYWGVVLAEISHQARIGGQRYAADAWHELFKRQFMERKVRKTTVAGRKRKVVSVTIGSTTELGVRAMGDYLDRVQAFAATDLGVMFSVSNWKEYVDPETGEVHAN